MPYNKVKGIRKVIPFEEQIKGNYLLRKGYYTFYPNPNHKKVNTLGFRGKEPRKNKRILCLGGSTTYGYGVETPYPEIMDKLLPGYSVINGGMEGANIQHIYNMLCDEEFMAKVNPQILVINTFWNSIEQYENNLLVESIENGFLRWCMRKSLFVFLSYKAVLVLRYGEATSSLQCLCVYLDKICRLAEKKGFSVFLVNEPMLLDFDTWDCAPQHPKMHEKGDAIFRKFAEKSPIVYFVFIPPLGNEYFIDRGHLTEKGYTIEAEAIVEQINRRDLSSMDKETIRNK